MVGSPSRPFFPSFLPSLTEEPVHMLGYICILGDPGAASRDDALFSGEDIFGPKFTVSTHGLLL